MKLFTYATSPYARKARMALDYKSVSYEPFERCHSLDRKEDLRCVREPGRVPAPAGLDGAGAPHRADHERATKALAETPIVAEFEGPAGRIHWRDRRLEWPIRHGFIDLVAREFHAGKMMFPPHAS